MPINRLHSLVAVTYLLAAILAFAAQPLLADEIVIDSSQERPIELGGVSWSPRFGFAGNVLELSSTSNHMTPVQSCELTAGELWRFFKSQGIESVDHLTVLLSVPNTTLGDSLVVENLELMIAEASQQGSVLMLANAGDGDRVVIPGGQTISGRAEAKMMIPLGFDFMEKYSENSTDKLVLNYRFEGASSAESPTFMVEGSKKWSQLPTYALVSLFAGFWLVLFWVLRVVTLVKPRASKRSRNGGGRSQPPAEPKEVVGETSNATVTLPHVEAVPLPGKKPFSLTRTA